jgi:hypothetical protein
MSGSCRSFFHTISHAMWVTVGGVLLCAGLPTLGMAQHLPQSCARNNGTWLEQYQECEYASKQWCAAKGGRFDECASACRHDPNPATPCTMQCVPVCRFPGAAPHSATRTTTRIFKFCANGDLNGDGRNGSSVLLVRNPGGRRGANAIPVGDRVAPKSLTRETSELRPLLSPSFLLR